MWLIIHAQISVNHCKWKGPRALNLCCPSLEWSGFITYIRYQWFSCCLWAIWIWEPFWIGRPSFVIMCLCLSKMVVLVHACQELIIFEMLPGMTLVWGNVLLRSTPVGIMDLIISSSPGQNGCHLADNIFRYIFVNQMTQINNPALV